MVETLSIRFKHEISLASPFYENGNRLLHGLGQGHDPHLTILISYLETKTFYYAFLSLDYTVPI